MLGRREFLISLVAVPGALKRISKPEPVDLCEGCQRLCNWHGRFYASICCTCRVSGECYGTLSCAFYPGRSCLDYEPVSGVVKKEIVRSLFLDAPGYPKFFETLCRVNGKSNVHREVIHFNWADDQHVPSVSRTGCPCGRPVEKK